MVAIDALASLTRIVRAWRGALLVQLQSMGFWKGKQFRFYHEFNLADTGTFTLQFTATKPFLLQEQMLLVDQGGMRIQIFTGATDGGGWVASQNVNAKYRIDMNPVSAVTVNEEGVFTGGTEREVLRTKSPTGSGQSATSTVAAGSIRGLPAGTYYVRGVATGTTSGIYSLEWEDID